MWCLLSEVGNFISSDKAAARKRWAASFPIKLMTQSGSYASDSVNKMQAGIYKGITSHELRIMLCILAPSASTKQMNTLRIALKE